MPRVFVAYKLPSGKYRYRDWVDVDGVRQRKSFTGTSPTDAKAQWKKYLSSQDKVAIESVKTVKQWADHWLTVYKEPYVSWKVGQDYRMYVEKHILPAVMHEKKAGKQIESVTFGSLKLSDVRPAHISKIYAGSTNKTGKHLGKSGINYIKISLNGIFNTAIENRLCTINPAANVKTPEIAQKEIQAFTKLQMEHIIQFLDKHENGPYIAMLLYTGMRIGELLALMWSDIDCSEHVIHIRRTQRRGEYGTEIGDTTKGKKARIIAFDDANWTMLQFFMDKVPKSGLYVIMKNSSEYHTYHSFEKVYYSFFDHLNTTLLKDKKEPIPRMTPHKCRHTFATYLMKNMVDIRVIQALLGHSKISTTEMYTHVDIDDLKTNVAKLKFN